ncbi:MAG TPA: NAD(P)/FAD-dependent oxidoreductase [Firmicutes bacterium]|nr:NAD(P)/FAD-dependent oxidoreductase [Bacillota bacterium]
MEKHYDVVIIGAGIVGTTIARQLSRYRLNILIVEKGIDVAMGATKANSAIVHGGYAEPHTTLKGRLCYAGRQAFARLNEELNFGFKESGSLVVTADDDPAPLYRLLEQGRANGLTDLRIVSQDELREMEPQLTPDLKWGLLCEGAGVCSPYEMAIAMAENAIMNGAELKLESEVKAIGGSKGNFVVETPSGSFQTRYVINAAGVQADVVSQMVGLDDFSILPRSGQYLLFARGSGKAVNHVIFGLPTEKGKGILLTSTIYENLLIGPDASEQEDREDTSTDVQRMAAIYDTCKDLYPGLDAKQFLRSFTGIRARSSTDDFLIEETKVPGFIQVAGIQSPGLTASPAIAEMVEGLLVSSGLVLEPNPDFDPYRKPIIQHKELRPLREIKPLLDIPSAPEKVICRCEQVTEGEIIDACGRGIPVKTIDGVKRRTRASMGWCQGTFCRPRIVEVMQRITDEFDARFDIEHSGVSRVEKSELLDFLTSRADK